jgi:hypothetical protein
LASWWQYHTHAASETREATGDLQAQIAPLKTVEGRIQSSRSEIQGLQDYVKPLVKVAEEREYWAKAFADLNSRLPADYIWITSFEPPSKEDLKKAETEAAAATAGPGKKPVKTKEPEAPVVKVLVKGIYLSRDAGNNTGPNVVDTFAESLKESPFFEPILKAEDGYVRFGDDTQEWGFKYAIPLKLKNPIDLK